MLELDWTADVVISKEIIEGVVVALSSRECFALHYCFHCAL